MKKIVSRKLIMLYLILKELIFGKFKRLKIYNTEETLNFLLSSKVSISRFGDGEFNILAGKDLKFQKYDKMLSLKLGKILNLSYELENHIVAIPFVMNSYFGYTFKSKFFWLKYFAQNRGRVIKNLDLNYNYFDSQVSRVYINRMNKNNSLKYFTKWKNLWNGKNILIVEGASSRFGVGNDLFDNTESVSRILCPPMNAFDYYNDILDSIYLSNKHDLILLVLGPTATVMAYDLAQNGIRAIDIGNMDMEYEWMNLRAKSQIAIAGRYTVEAADGDKFISIEDEVYQRQIIAKIGC